ncbi:MAG: S53 family peptidase [Acidimicrobiales bacterium]
MNHRSPRLASAVAFAASVVVGLVPLASAGGAQARVVVAQPAAIPPTYSSVAGPITTSFDVALAEPNHAALTAFLAGLTNPASPDYRHFLTTAQFAARFGARADVVDAVRRYFASFHLRVGALSRGRIILPVSGSTTDIARAFSASVATVRTPTHLAAQFVTPATLPAPIARDVRAVAGLSTVVTPHALALSRRVTNHVATPTTCANATGGQSPSATTPNGLGGYSVQQQARLYGLDSAWANGFTGAGATIAVYELGSYSPSDLATYDACYGLTPTVTNVAVDGGATGAYSDEATLDVEEATALAPGAAIEVYAAPNNSAGPVDAYQRIADNNTASVVTTSWGTCEQDPNGAVNAEQAIFEQMAAQGQTVVAASGDNGSSDCNGITTNAPAVDDPASQPLVTGVGGLSVSSIAPLSESVWNSGVGSGGGAGGGGVSTIWSRPAWQSAPGIAPSESMRLVPDLSVMADPSTGFIQYFTGTGVIDCGANCGSGWSSIGGTSIGAPLVSALVAVGAQQCGVSRLGLINPALYAMATTGFNDVTRGNNDIFGVGVYNAGPGYDMASGLGSPNATTFLSGLCPIAFDAGASTARVSTNRLRANTTATVTFALRNQDGGPVANASVSVAASAPGGVVRFNADPSSQTGPGSASYAVTTDASGAGSVRVSNSLPGPLTVTVTYQNATLLNSLITVTPSLTSLRAPTITRVVPLAGGAQLFATVPDALTVSSFQYSLDNGRTWAVASRRGASLIIRRLSAGVAYDVVVRYVVADRRSPASRATAIAARVA